MTIAKQQIERLSPEEYLVWESEQYIKYEYENGKIVAMTGGTFPHSQVTANLAAILIPVLRGSGCKVAISDAKVKTPSGRFYYPALVVTCDDRDRFARDFVEHPSIIIEALSPSKEARDRGVKQQHYMLIDTLHTYILITPESPSVEIYQRSGANSWEYFVSSSLGDSFVITTLGVEISISDIYENISFLPTE